MRWPRSERAEVTIDANLSECHVSAAAGTQYTHAMDDDGTAGRSTVPLNPCLLHPYTFTRLAMGPSRRWCVRDEP